MGGVILDDNTQRITPGNGHNSAEALAMMQPSRGRRNNSAEMQKFLSHPRRETEMKLGPVKGTEVGYEAVYHFMYQRERALKFF